MTRTTFALDAGIVAILTVLVIVLAPGWAVVGLIAIVVVLVCAISFAIDRVRGRRRARPPASLRRLDRTYGSHSRADRPRSRR